MSRSSRTPSPFVLARCSAVLLLTASLVGAGIEARAVDERSPPVPATTIARASAGGETGSCSRAADCGAEPSGARGLPVQAALPAAAPPPDAAGGRSAFGPPGSTAPRPADPASGPDVARAPAPGTGPANDECVDALPIAGLGPFHYETLLATASGPDHPACDASGSAVIDSDVWFEWTALDTGLHTIDTCGWPVDTKIAVYSDAVCPVSDATLVDCNDDACGFQSVVELFTTAGSRHLVRIGMFPGAPGGMAYLNVNVTPTPMNDRCADALAVPVPSTTPGSTRAATPDDVAACGTPVTAPGVWYEVVGTGETLTARTCGPGTTFDAKLGVYCGPCEHAGGPSCVTGSDAGCAGTVGEGASVTWCSRRGVVYRVLVHGFAGARGDFELSLETDGRRCTDAVGCEPMGACCLPDGTCSFGTAADCAAAGGAYQGDDAPCTDVVWAPVVCSKGWEEVGAVSTPLLLGDDDQASVDIGFAFPFWGRAYGSITVSSNGYLTFGPDGSDAANDVIPDASEPNLLVAPFWDDLDPSAGGEVSWATTGPAGNRAFVVVWRDVPRHGLGDANTFEAILFEADGRISFRYLDVSPESVPGERSVGIEDGSGASGASFPGSAAAPGVCLEFVPSPAGSPCDRASVRNR